MPSLSRGERANGGFANSRQSLGAGRGSGNDNALGGAAGVDGAPLGQARPQGPRLPDGPLRQAGEQFLADRQKTPIHAEHGLNKAIYHHLVDARNSTTTSARSWTSCSRWVTWSARRDVIAAAGRVVARGVPAREMAGVLADMPTQAGQGLAAWLQQMDAAVTREEMLIDQTGQIAAYRMGLSAQRVIAAEHLMGEARQQTGAMGALAPRGRQDAAQAPQPAGGQRPGIPQPSIIEMTPRPSEIPQGAGAVEAT